MSAPLFEGVLGQEQAVQLLSSALRLQRLAPAYLFSGPDGVGRSLVALRFLEGLCGAGLEGDLELRRRLQLVRWAQTRKARMRTSSRQVPLSSR